MRCSGFESENNSSFQNALAVDLIARAKAELQERNIAIAEQCGLPLRKVE